MRSIPPEAKRGWQELTLAISYHQEGRAHGISAAGLALCCAAIVLLMPVESAFFFPLVEACAITALIAAAASCLCASGAAELYAAAAGRWGAMSACREGLKSQAQSPGELAALSLLAGRAPDPNETPLMAWPWARPYPKKNGDAF